MTINHRPRLPYIALLSAVAIWGINFHSVHIGLKYFPLFAFLTFRFLLAFASYVPRMLQMRRAPLKSDFRRSQKIVSRSTFVASALAVGFFLSVFYGLQSERIGQRYGTLDAAFLTATVVLWVPVLSKCFFPKRKVFQKDVVVGVLLSIAGLAVIEGLDFSSIAQGNLLALGGAVALAAELIIIGEIAPRLPSYKLLQWTALYTLVSTLLFGVMWLVFEPSVLLPLSTDAGLPVVLQKRSSGVAALLFTGLVATGLANYLANWANAQKDNLGTPVITATHRGIMENLDAPLAFAFGLAFFRWNVESLDYTKFGYVLIVAAILIAELQLVSKVFNSEKKESAL